MRIGCIYIYTYAFIYVYIYIVYIYIYIVYVYIYIHTLTRGLNHWCFMGHRSWDPVLGESHLMQMYEHLRDIPY